MMLHGIFLILECDFCTLIVMVAILLILSTAAVDILS